jgi:hypothetical protein
VVPLSLLPELRMLSDDVLSFPDAVTKVGETTLPMFDSKTLTVYRPWKSNTHVSSQKGL